MGGPAQIFICALIDGAPFVNDANQPDQSMNSVIVASILLLLASHGTAVAEVRETPSRAEIRLADRCLDGAGDKKHAAMACVGKVAQSCMAQPGGGSTFGMRICLNREIKIWDDRLNRSYQTFRASLDGKVRNALVEVQKGWIEWRDKKCDFPYTMHEGGTIAGVAAADCVLETTAMRAIELRSLTGHR
jgi:uncharacterized protein YecT (DUF1311 family)